MGLFPGEVEIAKQRAEEAKARVVVYTSEATLFPFHTGEFDFVFDPRVYDSLQGEEQDLFVQEVHRVLRPGGIFVVVTPYYKDSPRGCFTQESVQDRFHPLFEVMRVVETGSVDEGHSLRYYYSSMMRKR